MITSGAVDYRVPVASASLMHRSTVDVAVDAQVYSEDLGNSFIPERLSLRARSRRGRTR
jgi:hypothetical protein